MIATTLPRAEAARLDDAAARLGVSADDIAAAAVVHFLAGRIAPRHTSRKTRASTPRRSLVSGRITPRPATA